MKTTHTMPISVVGLAAKLINDASLIGAKQYPVATIISMLMKKEKDNKFKGWLPHWVNIPCVGREIEDEAVSIPWAKLKVLESLEVCQLKAMFHVMRTFKKAHDKALLHLEKRVKAIPQYTKADLDSCLKFIQEEAPIIIHLRENTLAWLIQDTHYRNRSEGVEAGTILPNPAYQKLRERWKKYVWRSLCSIETF
jgi:hypothetical protein